MTKEENYSPEEEKKESVLDFEEAKEMAVAHGYSFLQVKTVQMRRYDEYDATNRFYISLGFKEVEVLPTLWGEENPCQIYVMSLK
mgnify:CR=1 FL=1